MENSFEEAVATELPEAGNDGPSACEESDAPQNGEVIEFPQKSVVGPEEYCRRTIGSVELVVDERVVRFLNETGWERTVQEMESGTYHIIRSADSFDTASGEWLDLDSTYIAGRRRVKVEDNGSITMILKDEDVYTDDLAILLAVNEALETKTPLPQVFDKVGTSAHEEPIEPVEVGPLNPDGSPVFLPTQLVVLKELWRSRAELSEVTGVPEAAISNRLGRAKERCGAEDIRELFFYAVEHGLIDVQSAPINAVMPERLSPRETEILDHIHLSEAEMTERLGGFGSTVSRLMSKTGAANRFELWIMKTRGETVPDEPGAEQPNPGPVLTEMDERIGQDLKKLSEDDTESSMDNAEARKIVAGFTTREWEVLSRLDQPEGQVAHDMKLRTSSVRTHVHNMMKKAELSSRIELLLLAFKADVLSMEADPATIGVTRLSDREIEVTTLSFLTYREIAARKGVSHSTVRTHIHGAISKAQVCNRRELVAAAIRHGVIGIDEIDSNPSVESESQVWEGKPVGERPEAVRITWEIPGGVGKKTDPAELEKRADEAIDRFTTQELEVLELIDRPTVEIAVDQGISEQAVGQTIKGMLSKAKVDSRIDLVLLGLRSSVLSRSPKPEEHGISELGPQERNLVRFIRFSNKKLADRFGINKENVAALVSRTFKKAGVTSRHELTAAAVRNGLLEIDDFEPAPIDPKDQFGAGTWARPKRR